jgi:uncharacterized protein with HEPN domain
MPRDDARTFVFDIRRAAGQISQFTRDCTFDDYQASDMLRSAVERQFEIAGEALAKLYRVAPELASRIRDARRIIDFRNVLIHGYGQVDDHLVWSIVQTKLPNLIHDIAALVDEGSGRISLPRERQFAHYVGIDYSGASTADARLPGLCVYVATGDTRPDERFPHRGLRWSRTGLAEWLVAFLAENSGVIVGIDHGFSFPLSYFERHGLDRAWPAFLDDFQRHWPTDGKAGSVDDIRKGLVGAGNLRDGENRWRRMTEIRAKAKSVFHFDVTGSVAKSTHAGLPWLRYIRRSVTPMPHFWPFDGWDIEAGRSAVVEVYPRLWSGDYDPSERNPNQHDAYSVARWLRDGDASGALAAALRGPGDEAARTAALIEGWILGVG